MRPTKSPTVQRAKAAARTDDQVREGNRAVNREIAKLLSTGNREIARGVGHDLEDVLAEAKVSLKRR